MTEDRPRKLEPWKRLLGVLGLTAVTLASAVGAYYLVRGGGEAPAPLEQEGASPLISNLFGIVLGFLFFGAAIFAYVIILVTNAFTFDFNRPFWSSLKVKLWFFNIAVLVLAAVGLGFFGRAILGPILAGLGLPVPLADIVPMIGALLVVQVALVWLNLWAPLEKACIRRRLEGYGVTRRSLDAGWLVGISDPATSSMKKMTAIEDDLGMLWLRDDQLAYRGDSQGFDVPRGDLLEVERAGDAASVQALGGAVHVILRFRGEGGAERRVRLHASGCWHMGAVKERLETMAARLEAWRVAGATQAPG